MYNNNIYINYLETFGIFSENEFKKIIDSLPEFDYEHIDWPTYDSVDEFTEELINIISKDICSSSYPYIENLNYETKSFEIYDVESLEDLEKIKNSFIGWEIVNYNDLIDAIKELEEENKEDDERERKYTFFRQIVDNITLEELQSIYDKFKK